MDPDENDSGQIPPAPSLVTLQPTLTHCTSSVVSTQSSNASTVNLSRRFSAGDDIDQVHDKRLRELDENGSDADDSEGDGRPLIPPFNPVGPREPESLHSWTWLTHRWKGLSYLLNERLREVSVSSKSLDYFYAALLCDHPLACSSLDNERLGKSLLRMPYILTTVVIDTPSYDPRWMGGIRCVPW